MGHYTGRLDSIRHIGYEKAFMHKRKLYLATNNVENPLTYYTNDRYIIELPRTLVSDIASIPWPACLIMPEAGGSTDEEQWYRPALFHDDWYQRNGVIMCGDGFIEKTRKWCDDRFFDMLIDCGVNRNTAMLMHTAVRVGGQSAWDRHRKVTA